MIFSSHADLNDFERGGTLGRKKRRQVTAEQVGREENLEFHVGIIQILMGIVTSCCQQPKYEYLHCVGGFQQVPFLGAELDGKAC